MKPYSVYALIDPRDRLPFYIGQTTNVDGRYRQHLANKDNATKAARVQELTAEGMKPLLIILEQVADKKSALERETHWRMHFPGVGIPLVNGSQGRPRLPNGELRKRIDVRLPPDLLVQMEDVCEVSGMTRTDLIENALRSYLDGIQYE